jgi:outer membrane protein assembly factor BamB
MRHCLHTISRRLLVVTVLLGWLGTIAAAEPAGEAAAGPQAWPVFRGTPAGTGRSRVTLRLPLREHWQRHFEGRSFTATPVIAAGRVYLGDLDGGFLALSLDTGKTSWEFQSNDSGFPSAAAVSTTDALPLVVVGDDLGIIRAFDRSSGRLVWTAETTGEISGGPTILAERDPPMVLVGSQDATLRCLRVTDGQTVWTHEIADQIRCSPTVGTSPDGERVFLAGCDGRLHIIAVDTGKAVAEVPLGGPTGTTPAVAGSKVFFGTEGGRFFAIDFVSGKVAWEHQPAANGLAYRSSAAVAGGLVVVGSRGRVVEAFAADDGSRRWQRPLRGRVDASPVLISAVDERLNGGEATPVAVVPDTAGRISMLRLSDGEPCWEFDAGGSFAGSAAVVADRLVVASEDGTVWCFRSGPVGGTGNSGR